MNIIPAAQARTVAQLTEGYFESPEFTETGIACFGCTAAERRAGRKGQLRHATVDHVRYCHNMYAQMEAEAKAERAAEAAVERFFEEGPHGPEVDHRERELWAMEDFLQGR